MTTHVVTVKTRIKKGKEEYSHKTDWNELFVEYGKDDLKQRLPGGRARTKILENTAMLRRRETKRERLQPGG